VTSWSLESMRTEYSMWTLSVGRASEVAACAVLALARVLPRQMRSARVLVLEKVVPALGARSRRRAEEVLARGVPRKIGLVLDFWLKAGGARPGCATTLGRSRRTPTLQLTWPSLALGTTELNGER
jgi:hypothetical protein